MQDSMTLAAAESGDDLTLGYHQIGRPELIEEAREFRLSYVLYVGRTIDGRKFVAVNVPSYGTWWPDGWESCCACCGKPFKMYGRRRRRYCSEECSAKFLAEWHSKTGYWTTYNRRRFGSEPVTRNCSLCSATFTTAKQNQRFCSSKCRKLDWWNRTGRQEPMRGLTLVAASSTGRQLPISELVLVAASNQEATR